MKDILLIITTLILTIKCYSQSPNWQWAKSIGEKYNDRALSVATDKAGNVVMTGLFSGSIVFGTDTFVASLNNSMYVVKYNSTGNILWAKCSGGSSSQQGNSITTDDLGNIYVAGEYAGNATFGPFNLGASMFAELFLLKYDASGNILWAKASVSVGATFSCAPTSIAVDTAGNVSVTGYFGTTSISFGSITLNNFGLNKYDGFLAKYDTNGNVLWAKRAGGMDDDFPYSVAFDEAGNTIIAGQFLSNNFTIGSTTIVSLGSSSMFIAKCDLNGNLLWAKAMGGHNINKACSVATDSLGNIFVGGFFSAAVCTFDTITITQPCCSMNMFLAKFNKSGNILWVKDVGRKSTGSSSEACYSIATDKVGNIFISGVINSSLTFGASHLDSPNSISLFVGKYDKSGNELWAKKVKGLGHYYHTPLAADAFGNIFVAGYFYDPNITFTFKTFQNAGQEQIYLAKLDSIIIPPVYDTINVAACNSYTLNGDNYFTSGTYFQTFTGFSGSDSVLFLNIKIDHISGYVYANGAGLIVDDTIGTYQWLDCNNGKLPIAGATQQRFKGAVPGSYCVKITNGACNTDTSICYNLNCVAYNTTTYDSILNTFTLIVDSVTSDLATSYRWDFGDGSTSNLPIPPPHQYVKDSLYRVCMKIHTPLGDSCQYCHIIGKDSFGNIVRASGFMLIVQNTSKLVNSINIVRENTISIAPNPFTSQTTISFGEEQKNSVIKIIDVLGKELKTIKFTGKKIHFEKGVIPAGIYFFQILDENKYVLTKRIVIQ